MILEVLSMNLGEFATKFGTSRMKALRLARRGNFEFQGQSWQATQGKSGSWSIRKADVVSGPESVAAYASRLGLTKEQFRDRVSRNEIHVEKINGVLCIAGSTPSPSPSPSVGSIDDQPDIESARLRKLLAESALLEKRLDDLSRSSFKAWGECLRRAIVRAGGSFASKGRNLRLSADHADAVSKMGVELKNEILFNLQQEMSEYEKSKSGN
jgi:hypothetical protein